MNLDTLHLIIPLTIILLFLFLAVSCMLNQNRYRFSNDMEVLRPFRKIAKNWLFICHFWKVIEYLLIIIPFEATAIVIYLSSNNSNCHYISILFYSILSLALIIFNNALKPTLNTTCYRKAFSILDKKIFQFYISKDQDRNIGDVSEALNDGETIISQIYDLDK